MKLLNEIIKDERVYVYQAGIDGGVARLKTGDAANIIFSWGGGWDHVSVSFPHRCPTWDEMCEVKDIFFEPEECVIQYLPPRGDYINRHPYCLHLWRPWNTEIPMPPKGMV